MSTDVVQDLIKFIIYAKNVFTNRYTKAGGVVFYTRKTKV